jgi:hypothetical protein
MPRRFPPPWTVEEHNSPCYIVRDADRRAVAYVYFEDEPGRRSSTNLLTGDEARRPIARGCCRQSPSTKAASEQSPLAAVLVAVTRSPDCRCGRAAVPIERAQVDVAGDAAGRAARPQEPIAGCNGGADGWHQANASCQMPIFVLTVTSLASTAWPNS